MKKCKVGLLGVGRGSMLWKYCKAAENAELVAVCDKWLEGLEKAKRESNNDQVTYYSDYDAFLKHDMDVVFLANYATEHAPFAIAAMKAGKNVISEVLPAQNPAEAVALIECVENTGRKYCYSENYCYMNGPREMASLYRQGTLGEFEYGEGEYLHNCEPIWHEITHGDPEHWRVNMSAFFYCSHSIGPLLHITGLRPISVLGVEMPFNERMARMGAKAGHSALELITLENGAVIKSLHGIGCSKNSVWYSMYTTKGRLETAREDAQCEEYSRIYKNIDTNEGVSENNIESYLPEDSLSKKATENGYDHGGSDYISLYNAFEYMNGNEADIIDVYEAINMWLPGFFGYLSVLNGSIPQNIPDLRKQSERDKYRNDLRCTDKRVAGDQLLPSYSKGNPYIEPAIYELWKKRWEESLPKPQLIMRWKNDGTAPKPLLLPEGVNVESFAARPTALEDWLELVQHGLSSKRMDESYYKACMSDRKWYDDNMCYFLVKDGNAIATITIICDPVKQEGYIHMVACKPEFRGQGFGTILSDLAVSVLKKNEMKTAYLTTDDFRIPAIKSYLKAGFEPDLSTEDFRKRWHQIS